MRELKFRAWDIDAKCYVEAPILVDNFGNVYEVYDEPSTIQGTCLITGKPNVILEQYTGLNDKNGKEIYEGDILGGIWEGGYISYCEKCKQFQYHSCGECMACLGDVHWYEIVEDDSKLEVIGNIHEYPKLLKEQDEAIDLVIKTENSNMVRGGE